MAAFVMAAMLSRGKPGGTEYTVRGGVNFGESPEAVKGQLTAEFLDEGWAIEILEVRLLATETIARIKAGI